MNVQHARFNPDEVVLLRTVLDEAAALLPAEKRTSETKALMVQKILVCAADLTGLFWTKLCEKLSLERSFGHAEEDV